MAGSITANGLAFMINDAGWGVTIDGDKDSAVGSGTYSGTLTEALDDIAADNGFDVSWNDTTHVVTLDFN